MSTRSIILIAVSVLNSRFLIRYDILKNFPLPTIYLSVSFLGAIAGWIIGEPILPVAEPLAGLFLRLLRMAIMPLIITSIISGVISVGSAAGLGRLGIRTFGYYILSTSDGHRNRSDPGEYICSRDRYQYWSGTFGTIRTGHKPEISGSFTQDHSGKSG